MILHRFRPILSSHPPFSPYPLLTNSVHHAYAPIISQAIYERTQCVPSPYPLRTLASDWSRSFWTLSLLFSSWNLFCWSFPNQFPSKEHGTLSVERTWKSKWSDLPGIRPITFENRHASCQCLLRSLVTYCEYSGDEDKFRSLILCGWG